MSNNSDQQTIPIEAVLNKLEIAIAAQGDDDYAQTHRFHSSQPLEEADVVAAENALGLAFPPSYREFLMKHGLFSLGTPERSHLAFQVWPLEEHQTALLRLADELDCEATVNAVATELGLNEEIVAVLEQIVLIGCEGHEDFVGFDLRTRNPETEECQFRLSLADDCEIEALANEDIHPCILRGFDEWLARHIKRRAR